MNRWYFWVLAPIAVARASFVPLVAEPPSPWGHGVVWAIIVAAGVADGADRV